MALWLLIILPVLALNVLVAVCGARHQSARPDRRNNQIRGDR